MFFVADILVSISAVAVSVGATGLARVVGPVVIRRVWQFIRSDIESR